MSQIADDPIATQPLNINFPKPKTPVVPNNPQPSTVPVPVTVPQPAPQPGSQPNPTPDDGSKVKPKLFPFPLDVPNFGNPFDPSGQQFPVPDPVTQPAKRPSAKPAPAKQPGRTIPFPKRTPAKTPAAAIDILEPFPAYQPKPWEIIPVGGLVSLPNNTTDAKPWFDPVIEYANELGAFGNDFAEGSAAFAVYLKEYDYSNFSVGGMYNDLVGMYGTAIAILLIGYIIVSIPAGIPGLPGV
jgi:hypothetical protein